MWNLISKEGVEEFRSMMAEIQSGSDRAAAIVAAACVEDQLGEALRVVMEKDETVIRDMFRSSGPLGSFSAKISLGYLLGLYEKDMKKEIDTIKEIRNVFAHRRETTGFDAQRARDLANNLSISETLDIFTPTSSEPVPLNDLKEGGVVWIALGMRDAASRESGTSLLPELAPGKTPSPREKYTRACQFYVTYLFMVIFRNLGQRTPGVGWVYPPGASWAASA
jgi:hypothetical protein